MAGMHTSWVGEPERSSRLTAACLVISVIALVWDWLECYQMEVCLRGLGSDFEMTTRKKEW